MTKSENFYWWLYLFGILGSTGHNPHTVQQEKKPVLNHYALKILTTFGHAICIMSVAKKNINFSIGMGGQNSIVWFDDSSSNLGSGVDIEFKFGLLAIINGETFYKKGESMSWTFFGLLVINICSMFFPYQTTYWQASFCFLHKWAMTFVFKISALNRVSTSFSLCETFKHSTSRANTYYTRLVYQHLPIISRKNKFWCVIPHNYTI